VCCEKQSAKLGFGGHFLVDAFAYGVVFLYELMQVQYPVAMSVISMHVYINARKWRRHAVS